jgi:hypothetical protein
MLVGIDRVRVVRDLGEMWEAAVAGRVLRGVVLEGSDGAGKTAVVQAFYERLAWQQPRPAYWPANLHTGWPPGWTSHEGSEDPGRAVARQERAAHIYPRSVKPDEGARPHLFWWGLNASPGVCAARSADAQIAEHVQHIARRSKPVIGSHGTG